MIHFGDRLKSARKMAGLSMEALAMKAGGVVTKQAISKYENDLMKPGSDSLIALSQALGVKPEYFLRPQEIALSGLEFRKKSKLAKKEEDSIKYRTLDFLERYLEIEDILDQKAVYENPISDNRINEHEDSENAAQELRRKWDLGNGPISNLMELLEDKGVRICEIEAGHHFHGISALAGNVPVIAVREQDDLVRKRLTVAHELGHILLKFRESGSQKKKEKLCYAFAAALLLPEKVIRAELGNRRSRIALGELVKLKESYGISIQAIMARAKDLNIISEYSYKNFCITMKSRGWWTDEPGEYLGKEHADRFSQLVLHAVAEDVITSSRGAELLNKPLSEFRQAFQIVS